MRSQPVPRNFHPPDRDDVDRDLLRRLNEGDAVAFRAIFDAYAAPLVLYAKSLIQNTTTVGEDIVHDLFTYLWTHRFTIEVSGGLRTYLYRATRNRCWSVLRHERVKRAMADRMDPEASFAVGRQLPSANHDEAELSSRLDTVLNALSDRQREIWKLNRDDELSYSEIASLLGISVKTVETHMGRTLREVRKYLADWR